MQVFFTEQLRNAADIAEKKIQNIKTGKTDLRIVKEITDEAIKILFSESDNKMNELGSLMNQQWLHKRTIEKSITNDHIDEIYSKGLKSGAVGGELS